MTSLECIDDASSVYLFECNKEWYEALDKTFEPYSDKVHIVHKFVSDRTDGEYVKLDDVLQIEDLNGRMCMIKMDIEGYEARALKGAQNLLKYHNLKLACCLYHNKEDEKTLVELIQETGFQVEVSNGYMLLYFREDLEYPYFRKVLARASRKEVVK